MPFWLLPNPIYQTSLIYITKYDSTFRVHVTRGSMDGVLDFKKVADVKRLLLLRRLEYSDLGLNVQMIITAYTRPHQIWRQYFQ